MTDLRDPFPVHLKPTVTVPVLTRKVFSECIVVSKLISPPTTTPFLIKTELKIEEEKGLHKYLTAAPSFLASVITSRTAKNLIF